MIVGDVVTMHIRNGTKLGRFSITPPYEIMRRRWCKKFKLELLHSARIRRRNDSQVTRSPGCHKNRQSPQLSSLNALQTSYIEKFSKNMNGKSKAAHPIVRQSLIFQSLRWRRFVFDDFDRNQFDKLRYFLMQLRLNSSTSHFRRECSFATKCITSVLRVKVRKISLFRFDYYRRKSRRSSPYLTIFNSNYLITTW